jgi:hypothetical protein
MACVKLSTSSILSLLLIKEGRVANKSLKNLGFFLSIVQQGVFSDSIQNSAVGNFFMKTEGTKERATTVGADKLAVPHKSRSLKI